MVAIFLKSTLPYIKMSSIEGQIRKKNSKGCCFFIKIRINLTNKGLNNDYYLAPKKQQENMKIVLQNIGKLFR